MHFCSKCENMYYIKIDEKNPNKLIYYCRKCGNENELFDTDNVTILNIFFTFDIVFFSSKSEIVL